MAKQLLTEKTEFISPIKISSDLKESISVEKGKDDILIVRNIPATIADRKNQNGRIYTTEVLQEAIKNAQFQLKTKWLYSQADEHPEGSFVAPTHASHVVINAYIKKNVKVFVEGKTERHNVMFMDWEILNTEEGKNLKALILQETACPTSIRGLGDMNGDYVTDYELLGCDVVSNPSSGTSMRMPVSESVKVERADKSYVNESFEVVTVSNDVVSDIESAAQKQVDIENAQYGTITNIKTKLDQEIDPKTHAETTITSIEATTTDQVGQLDQALQMAKNAFGNPVSKMDSVTITFVDDQENANKEAVEENEEACPCCGKAPCECGDDCECKCKDKKEFLDVKPVIGDVNVLGGQLKANSDSEQSQAENTENAALFPQTENEDSIVAGIKNAIKELNDQILNEKDPEKLKKLKMNRDEFEKLLKKNLESEEPVEEPAEVKEDLDKKDSDIEVNGNKLSLELDKDTTIEKELNNEKDAQIAKAALDNDKIAPEFMVSEDAQPNDNGGMDYTCDKATLDYKTGEFTCEDTQNEKLYNNPDEPSDTLVNKPLNDSDNNVLNVVLTNLDYDISDPENITADDEQYLSELPNEITVKLNIDSLPQEGEVDKFIIANAVDQTGLPIKNAEIKSVSMDLMPTEESFDEADETPANGNYTVYAFLNGQLKDELENLADENEAIEQAKSLTQQYENQGTNFQVIITKTDDKGFEDFDNLIYQYPHIDLDSEVPAEI